MSRNLFAVFFGCIIAILLVIVVDRAFGWYMDLKGSHSPLFSLDEDPDGLGWTVRVNSKKELEETTRNYSLARKKVRDGKLV